MRNSVVMSHTRLRVFLLLLFRRSGKHSKTSRRQARLGQQEVQATRLQAVLQGVQNY